MRLLALPVIVPLFAAALSLLAMRRLLAQRVIGVLATSAALGAAIGILVEVEADGVQALDVGAWPAPVGITLVGDLAAAMFLVMSLAVILLVQLFAIGQDADRVRPAIAHPVYLVLTAGVSLSFLTGDLFNLFVAFEVMLISSYVLITLGAGRDQIRSGMTYVVINVVASTMLLTTVGLIYGATGTVNMADLVEKFAELPESTRTVLGLLLLAVFSTKAAVFPFFSWLPDSYPAAPIAVTAVFAGLLTKVGVYTMIRSTSILGLDQLADTILVAAAVTMVIGGIGAVAQDDMKRILSFHIISQVGYMVMGLGLYTVAGLSAAVLYIVHQIPVKTVLFLVAGLVERTTGTNALHSLGGLLRRAPVIALLFALPALSLAGMPPFSGFLAKLAVVRAGIDAEQYVVVAASLAAAILTLLSMNKIWAGVFWGKPGEPVIDALREPEDGSAPPRLRAPRLMVWSTGAMVALTFAVPLFGGAIHDLSVRAAEDLIDPSAYVDAVFGTEAAEARP